MSMNRVVTIFAAAVINCVAGCSAIGPFLAPAVDDLRFATPKGAYVPPAPGEPQATIRGGNFSRWRFCNDVLLLVLDNQGIRYGSSFPAESVPISTGLHVAEISARYDRFLIDLCWVRCRATLQFTAEPSHAYKPAFVKEGDLYHIDLIDSETKNPVASAPCSKPRQPPAPEPDTRTGFMGTPY